MLPDKDEEITALRECLREKSEENERLQAQLSEGRDGYLETFEQLKLVRAENERLQAKLAEFKPVTMNMIDAAIPKDHPGAPSELLLSYLDAAGIYYR